MNRHIAVKFLKVAVAGLLLYYVYTLIEFQDQIVLKKTNAEDSTKVHLDVRFQSIHPMIQFEVDAEPTESDKEFFPAEWFTGKTVSLDARKFDEKYQSQLGFISLLRFARKDLFVGFSLLMLFTYLMAFYRWHLLLKPLQMNVSFREVAVISWMGMFFNNIFLSLVGGDIIRGIYIARRTKEKTIAVTTLMIDRIVGVIALAILAFLAVLPNLTNPDYLVVSVMVMVLMGVASVLSAMFFIDRVREALFHNRLLQSLPLYPILAKIAEAGRIYKHQKRLLVVTIALSFCAHTLLSIVFYGFGLAFGVKEVVFVEYLVIVPVCQLISSVPIAPAGWGVGEVAYTYFFQQMGEVATLGAAVSIAYRMSNICLSLPGALLWALSGKEYSTQALTTFDAEKKL